MEHTESDELCSRNCNPTLEISTATKTTKPLKQLGETNTCVQSLKTRYERREAVKRSAAWRIGAGTGGASLS